MTAYCMKAGSTGHRMEWRHRCVIADDQYHLERQRSEKQNKTRNRIQHTTEIEWFTGHVIAKKQTNKQKQKNKTSYTI